MSGRLGRGDCGVFADQFPKSNKEYTKYCRDNREEVEGTAFITSENVVCLMTSGDFGKKIDGKQEIVYNTIQALRDLFEQLPPDVNEIHSNKFNSGLFGVPWEDTAVVLAGTLKLYGPPHLKWTVWEYDDKK